MTDRPASSQPDPILEVEGVVRSFDGLLAVDGASMAVDTGSITALIGPNGAGKSTLFNVVTGFDPPEQGIVRFRGQAITHLPSHRIAGLGLVRTFQLTKVFDAMTVLDNLLVSAPQHPGELLVNPFLRAPAVRRHERRVREESLALLETFHLADKQDEYAGELSGGQRKLLELARVLMLQPAMVLLDEPMSGVNPTLGHQLLDHIHRLRDERGTTFLFVEHDMDVVMQNADRVIVMADGKVIARGLPEEVRGDPVVLEAYLGSGARRREEEGSG